LPLANETEHFCYCNANKGRKVCYLRSEVGCSRNLPAMLRIHNSARILTARINIQVTKYHKGKQPNVLTNHFTKKSIWRQVRIFSPVNCKQKLTGEMRKC